MIRNYLLICIFAILAITIVTVSVLFSNRQARLSFVSHKHDATNLIDVLNLKQDDYQYISKGKYNTLFLTKDYNQQQVFFHNKPVRTLALSPSQKQLAFFYLPDYQSSEKLTLMLSDKEQGNAGEIYHTQFASWDVRSDLHWLGNDYLFFLRHCGTACQGITLLNLKSGKTKNAVLSYSSSPNQSAKTHFKDWRGQEFVMDGLASNITSTTEDNLSYLIFILKDSAGNFLGEKKIQFIGIEPAR